MIGRQDRWQEDLFVAGPLSSLIPEDHILKQVDKVLDLSWLRGEVKDLYCCDNGHLNGPDFVSYEVSGYLDTSCHQNVSIDLDFALMAADKYHSLGQIMTFSGTR